MRPSQSARQILSPLLRIRMWYGFVVLIFSLFIIRLFYLQVIKHDYYQSAALRGQLKEYEIPPERGIIEAYNGEERVPLVLNQRLYTLFADPKFITAPEEYALAIEKIIGGKAAEYEEKMKSPNMRYVVLAKKLSEEQKDSLDKLEFKGIGTRAESYRTYPQETLASQLLGFVNDEGEGKYGIEQALNDSLKGEPGLLKAITDVQGVPLASHKDNVIKEAKNGERIILTIDIGMQKLVEDILKQGLKDAKSKSGSVVVMEAQTGAVKAMANYPTYNPAEFFKVEDANVFNNAVVSAPLEVGSIMKPLTAAAALDMGAISKNSSYFDPGHYRIDNALITNIEEVGGAGQKDVRAILQQSLNTGATWMLMQMGGGEINEQARKRWHDYMVNRYRFGELTGVEQGYESGGSIPSPTEGYGLNIQYANTAFGQGMTATPLQMSAALASIINGGTYYKPRLVDRIVKHDGTEVVKKPEIIHKSVVKPEVGSTIKEFMEYVVERNNRPAYREGYSVGGKTGTAQIARPEGGYYEDRYNGMYLGFVGGNEPEYVIVVRVNNPRIYGYAGSQAAGPIFTKVSKMLIDSFGVTPKR